VRTPSRSGGLSCMTWWAALPLLLFVSLACARLVAGGPALGGGIQGTVKTPKEMPVPHAKVTLNSGSRIAPPSTATTTADGHYQITSLLPGAYVVCVEAAGYDGSQRDGMVVNADAITVVDFTLTPAAKSPTGERSSLAETPVTACQTRFFDNSGMKAAGLTGSVDPVGYSASAGAKTSSSLIQGATDIEEQGNLTVRDEGTVAAGNLRVSPTVAQNRLKHLQEADPESFQGNHDLGEFDLESGKVASAIPFLETARRANPADYENDYLLARAYGEIRKLPDARVLIAETIALRNTAELHNLLAQVEESQGDPRAALQEYERAFEMEPNERNRYNWGLELVLQGDIASALKLFQEGVTLSPQSVKLWIGLGIALYSGGHSEDAVGAFLRATDLNPADPRPYLSLGKAYDVSSNSTAAVNTRLNQWMQLEPRNAQPYYYCALSLWKGKRNSGLDPDLGKIESLFKESALLDPTFPFAHLQLGNLYTEEDRILEAIGEYQDTVRLKPALAEAHYHLGQAFLRTGQKELGQQQMVIYEQLHGKPSPDADLVEGQSLVKSIKGRSETSLVPP
jgi:tetratricopeptide (TPR) repeat protein